MEAHYIVTLTDPDKSTFLEELLSHLKFVEFERVDKPKKRKWTKKEKEYLEGLREAIQEMKDDIAGKKKLPSARSAIKKLKHDRKGLGKSSKDHGNRAK
ncbi:MAG: hypothetical protein KF905_10970 [Flavobacteriales bacterium]|nr:hypothetical protein [Flavobacteriales bacterium]